MRPAEYSVSGLTSSAVTFLRSDKFTTWFSIRNGLVKPRLGSRRNIGICPPSKPGLVPPPVRALCPLCPLPEVFPKPEPGPRPTRFLDCVDPVAGFKLDRVIFFSMSYSKNERGLLTALVTGRHLDEVSHFVQHAAYRRSVGQPHRLLMMVQTQRTKRTPHRLWMADLGSDLFYRQSTGFVFRRD